MHPNAMHWDGEEVGPAVAGLRRMGETWRYAREELRELPPHALAALAARERLPETAQLVQSLADEVAVGRPAGR